mgnify:FL=1
MMSAETKTSTLETGRIFFIGMSLKQVQELKVPAPSKIYYLPGIPSEKAIGILLFAGETLIYPCISW